MTFRKEASTYYEVKIVSIFCAFLCLILFFGMGLKFLIFLSLLFTVLVFVSPRLWPEFIIINEVGISCSRSGQQVWDYKWDDIVELKKVSHYQHPSVKIVVHHFRDMEDGKGVDYCFQLSRTAKKALKKYHRWSRF